MTYAEAKRAYRARAIERHGKLKRYEKTLFGHGRFVAVDGEGFNDGADIRQEIGRTVYDTRDHFYGLLMDSDDNEVLASCAEHAGRMTDGRLSTKQCLDFLLDIPLRDKTAIPVIFGGSYDACHMLAFGMERSDVQTLLKSGNTTGRRQYLDIGLSHDGSDHDYRLEYRPRKSFTVWRFAHGADKYIAHHKRDGTRTWKLNYEARVTLWDVWGFFQGSFLAAMDAWIPDDPDRQFIANWKGKRGDFERSEIADIRRYTAAELRCLLAMMERVRDSIRSLDLTVTRWDGAGAIAGAFFKKHDVKHHMGVTPPEVFEAARRAYSGGHIEATVLGHHSGKVWHYDINSAYPHQFRRLPGLAVGKWQSVFGPLQERETPPEGFTLVELEFHFLPGLPFYPLFHRAENGAILYPQRGRGWYWFDEYACARDFAERQGAFTFRVLAFHTFETFHNASPFNWIEDAYQIRRDVIMRSRETGVRDDSHMMIRLGLNSCYGKTAQQVGARYEQGKIVPPTYFQIEWAGAVTAGCRAQLMRAALQKPEHVISFATDALFATAPLDLPCSPEKRLGEWEAHEHDGMTIVMPGVYWLHEGGSVKHFSRGFDKQTMSDCNFVMDAWKRRQSSVMVAQHRMITLGAAMTSDNLWKLRGLFVTTQRELMINGLNSKRYPAAMTQVRPHKELVRLRARDHDEDLSVPLSALVSAPYPIKWLDQPRDEETENDLIDNPFLLDADTSDSAFLA
jgi:hypothetical protein